MDDEVTYDSTGEDEIITDNKLDTVLPAAKVCSIFHVTLNLTIFMKI